MPTRAANAAIDPELLQYLERRIEREIERITRAAQQAQHGDTLRAADYLDIAASQQQREEAAAVLARCADGLQEWTQALQRLRETPERFGLCERCGTAIPAARLELIPTATMHVDC